ncbi:hypothetical protein QA601_15800 [Chitinispirillales bacterium ANBcel5]|uniref:hypothetical protein n=1 Tax=Cellulosispirillum alkaliphilum TaxID=3039283 RepID=UPI002A58E0BE|nr:hypothetical protein [Chitinispirillales bacterium ANBcel5]
MKAIIYSLITSVLLLGAFNCTSNVAGTASETTNGISAKVSMPDGSVAKNATVKIIDNKNWLRRKKEGNSVVIHRAHTDNSGFFNIDSIDLSHFNLQIICTNSVHFVTNAQQVYELNSDRNHITLQEGLELSGEISIDTENPGSLYLFGTDFSSHIDEHNHFSFPALPHSQFTPVVEFGSPIQRSYTVAPPVQTDPYITTVTIESRSNSILVDNFNDQSPTSFLHGILGNSYWYVVSDDQGSMVLPESIYDNFATAFVPTDRAGEDGYILDVEFSINQDYFERFALFGVDLGIENSSMYHNLSDMTGLSFRAKGSGIITVQFITKSGETATIPYTHETTIELNQEWSDFTVSVAELFPNHENGVTWQEASHEVKGFSFLSTENSEMSIDEVVVEGVVVSDLLE